MKDFCEDCSSRRGLLGKASKFGAVAAFASFFGIGGKNIVTNAVANDEPVPMTPAQLQAWITSPGLIDAYPMDGLDTERQNQIKAAITAGDWKYFQGTIAVDPPKAGVAEAACGWYYSYRCISCCQRWYWHCYQCNGETQFCDGPYSQNYNCGCC